MEFTYERDMTHNYMVPQADKKLEENDYRVHMLMENQIRGLLPCTVQKKDGREEFRYDITSKQALEHIYSGRYISEWEIRFFLHGLLQTLTELKTYLLDASMLVLEPQMIYMDVETREPFFCYLPGYTKEITEAFRELSGYILQHLLASDHRAVLLGYRIYRESLEENYCLERLLKQAGMVKEEDYSKKTYFMGEYGSTREYREDFRKVENNMEDDGQNFYKEQDSFKAASKRTVLYEKENEDLEQTDSREHSLEESPKKIKQSSRQKKQQQKTESHREKIQKKEVKMQRRMEKKVRQKPEKAGKQKKNTKEQKFTGKSFLIVCFVLAVLMTLAAAWLWKLSTTQTGGILFLLIGLMAYGCSMEPKKVSAKKEETDYEAYGLEEQPYIMEKAEHEEEWQEQKSNIRKEREFRNQSETEKKSDMSEHRKRQEYLGNTAVLYEQDLSEEPLMLIRINSREREQIVLQEEQYIVGKLNAEASLVIRDDSVSRVHAKIERLAGQYILRDMNSTNGTFLNGRRLQNQEHVLIQPGDRIAFARAEYQVVRY